MEAGWNGNNRWESEGNGNKTRLNLEVGMEIDKLEWEGLGILIVFPHTSTSAMAKTIHTVKDRSPNMGKRFVN